MHICTMYVHGCVQILTAIYTSPVREPPVDQTMSMQALLM